jgi:hypothetical protein
MVQQLPDVPGEVEDQGIYIPLLTGRFDATDAAMRGHGGDPYGYEKQRFLGESAEARERSERPRRSWYSSGGWTRAT